MVSGVRETKVRTLKPEGFGAETAKVGEKRPT